MTVHEGKDPYTCDKRDEGGKGCGLGFDTEGKLNSHIGRVHGTKRFVCVVCLSDLEIDDQDGSQVQLEKGFPTHAALQAHVASEHPPTCSECGLRCTSQSALKNHAEVVHGGLDADERKTHICQEPNCGRGFTKKGNLNAHIQISHTGKRFICGEFELRKLKNISDWNGSDACGEALRSKANLEKHIRAVHLGLDPSGKANKNGEKNSIRRSGQTPQVSTLTRLTGLGYEIESGRFIRCLIHDCDHRFVREYDLEIHLQSQHGLADLDIQEMKERRERGALDKLNVPYPCAIRMNGMNEGSSGSAGFLLDGDCSQGGDYDDPWFDDEMEMENIVGGDYMYNGEDVDMIDPCLV